MDIFTAILQNDVSSVYIFLKDQLNDPNERNDNGLTGLHLCATHGLIDVAVLLLTFGADLSLKDYESGYTPLHRSFYFGHFKLSWLFLRHGAKLDDDCNIFNFTFQNKDINAQRIINTELLNDYSLECKDKEGLSPFSLLSSVLSCKEKQNTACTFTNAFVFGKADYQLGVYLPNASTDVVKPKFIDMQSNSPIVQVATNKHHSVAINEVGEIFSWGHGRNGRLGHSDENMQLLPKLIGGFKPRMISIATGLNHSLALSENGEIFSWGSDRHGQLGHGLHNSDIGICKQPLRIEALKKYRITAISAGECHSVCVSAGEIYAWGSNKSGQLGLKSSDTQSHSGCPISPFPKKVDFKISSKDNNKLIVKQISAAYSCTLALVNKSNDINEVYEWGNGCLSPIRVFFPVYDPCTPSIPTDMMFCSSAVNIVQIACGKYHNVGVSDFGHVYTWGLGADQLGHLSETNHSPPKLVEELLPQRGGAKIVNVSASCNRTCVVSEHGDLYCWGATNDKGILGHNANSSFQPIPKRVPGVKRAVNVSVAEDYTVVLCRFILPQLPLNQFYKSLTTEIVSPRDDSDDEVEEPSETSPRKPSVVINSYYESVPSLKQFCERRLAQYVDTKNVGVFYSVAETFEAPLLKSYCERFLNLNFDAVLLHSKPHDLDYLLCEHTFERIVRGFVTIDEKNSHLSKSFSIKNDNVITIQPRQPLRSRSYSVDLNDTSEKDVSTNRSGKALPSDSSAHISREYRTKDLKTAASVGKLIRTVKKKLSSIDDLLRSKQMNLTKEQTEKIEKKPSLESELGRLTLIYDRLQREEEVMMKAKLSRHESMNESEKSNLESPDSVENTIRVDSSNSSANVIPSVSPLKDETNMNVNIDSKALMRVSAVSPNVSYLMKFKESQQTTMSSIEDVKTPSKPTVNPDIVVKSSPWGHRSGTLTSTSSTSQIPLSTIGLHGQTVLSPSKPLSVDKKDKTVIKVTSTPVKVGSVQSKGVSVISSTTAKPAEDSAESGGLTLAAFMPAKTKISESSKPKSISTPFKWGSSSCGVSSDPLNSSSEKMIVNPSMTEDLMRTERKRTTSLLDIQEQEHVMKQQSNVNYDANTNPWYIERRPRAPSIDEIAKHEEAQKLEEKRRIQEEKELQSALKAIAAAERREQRQLNRKAKKVS